MSIFYKIFIYFCLRKVSNDFIGKLVVIFPNKSKYIFGNGKESVNFTIKRNFFFIRVLLNGITGIGYSYYKGEWSTNNLPYVIETGIRNINQIKKLKRLNIVADRLIKKFHRGNTISRSKKQISYHYDLGNNFYKSWLDKTMTYSSAKFDEKNISLEKAQLNKYNSLTKLAKIKKIVLYWK